MSDRTRDLLVHGIAAAKAKSKQEARHYLEWVIDAPDAEQYEVIEAWRYIAEISDDPKEKRDCLEQVLAYDPSDPEARRALAILDGKLKPEDIVDPDHMPASAPAQPSGVRYVCSQCGGKMLFTPDGNALTCAYCGRHQSLISALDDGAMLEEQSFAVALATAKGHTKPTTVCSIKCQGCGASFVLPAKMISTNCPYCGSAYVLEQTETRELIEPEGIVPFAVSQDQAIHALLDWFRAEKFSLRGKPVPPSGVYLPVWTFDAGGEITWNCLVQETDALFNETEKWEPRSGSELVYENDLRVAASHALSATLIEEINNFPLDHLVPYDARYIVDWPAETYQTSVGDASLVARARVLAKVRPQIEANVAAMSYKDLRMSTMRLVIESYKLILVPLWIAHYIIEKKQYTIAINGHTGALRAEKTNQGVAKWLSGLLGEG